MKNDQSRHREIRRGLSNESDIKEVKTYLRRKEEMSEWREQTAVKLKTQEAIFV